MAGEMSPTDKAKFVAANRSAQYVEAGMRAGLGSGTNAAWLVRCLGGRVRNDGLRIKGVPTWIPRADLVRDVGPEIISFQ